MSPAQARERAELVDRLKAPGAAVLYLPAQVLGEVRHVFDPGEFQDANEQPIDAPVVLLSTGDSFLVSADTIVSVTGADLGYYNAVLAALARAITEATVRAGAGVELPNLVRLTRSALVMQKRALDVRSEEPG